MKKEKKEKSKRKRIILIIELSIIAAILGSCVYKFNRLMSKMFIDDISKYEEEYQNRDIQRFGFFPSSIPENATDVEFKSYHGLQSHEGGFILVVTLPEDEISTYLEDYKEELYFPEYIHQYPQNVCDFVGENPSSDRFKFYSDCRDGRGFVIDTNENRIMFFYDEYRCGND